MSTEPQRRYRAYVESTDAEIDADRRTLLNTLLESARGYDNRLSARDLAERTGINRSTVRDVVIELRDEFGVPVGNVGSGYFVVETDAELNRVVEYYEGEIQTKRERLETIQRTYESHTPMQPATDETPSVRQAIKDVVGDGSVPTGEVLERAADRAECDTEDARKELEALEEHGFAYIVGGEVRLP
jgi:biotin operon repressor